MQQKILDNRYELEHKIGEGGMARVYVGRDLRLSRRVAVKVLQGQYVSDRDFLDRFRHEAQAAAILTHPNVVDVYDVGQDGDIHYIVMEYIDGTDLKAVINREAPLAIDKAISIAEAVARGLEAAHRVGLVHRDIKPQNIIVAPDGYVRITDFGIAKSHLSTALTETGVTFGTVDYISPEQAQGKPATSRSDVYALGVTLYEMLTGRLPFIADNAVTVAMQHVSNPPPSLRQFNPQIPPQLEAVVLRALSKDPAQRPASAQEFARLLQGYRDMAQQETVYTASVPSRAPDSQLRLAKSATTNNHTTGRIIPPPRSAAATRAPRQDSTGCGTFMVGMFILSGILSLVFLFSIGAFDDLITDGPASASPFLRRTTIPDPNTTVTLSPAALVAVPDLVNRTDFAARSTLERLQLVPITTTAEYSSLVPEGFVLKQDIPPGAEIRQGQSVTYTLSLGPELITLSDYEGRRFDRSRDEIRSLGLNIEVVEEPSQTITEGFIIRQSPNPRARVQAEDTIRLVVSVGDKVRFPNVIGKGRAEAESILNSNSNFVLEYVDPQGRDRLPDFDRYFPGEVVSALANRETVRNGDLIPRGSRIVLGVRTEE
ncbi:MAG: Stk1 family PASTA domain-containing Ser/Thr kinase [Chloroflexales bacterium]|nr:Stk1 family PASTA domain-containing Ser/Thr kinase [Chloroflexales bacterium]